MFKIYAFLLSKNTFSGIPVVTVEARGYSAPADMPVRVAARRNTDYSAGLKCTRYMAQFQCLHLMALVYLPADKFGAIVTVCYLSIRVVFNVSHRLSWKLINSTTALMSIFKSGWQTHQHTQLTNVLPKKKFRSFGTLKRFQFSFLSY
jgi:hypothetical protein